MTIVDQLWEFYEKYEDWHKSRLAEAEARVYFTALLERGNIITVADGDRLLGYVEFWRLNYEQFGRIICGEEFSALHEDVSSGNVAYVANTYILPTARRGQVFKMLRDRFFAANRLCTHFIGEARRKNCAPLKVFRRNQVMKLQYAEAHHG